MSCRYLFREERGSVENSILEIKTGYEEYPIYFNFKNFLSSAETVSSFVYTCIKADTGVDSSSSIIEGTPSLSTPRVTVGIKGGTDGEIHKITITATTSLGQVFELEKFVEIDNSSIDGNFTIQPREDIIIACDFVNNPDMGSDSISTQSVTAIRTSDGTSATSAVVLASNIDGKKVLVKVGDCAINEIYRVESTITTASGNKHQMNILASCKEL
mgnify:FL=1